MTGFGRLVVTLGCVQGATSGCQSACFNLNQPECVDRFTGLRAVAHRQADGLQDHDAVADALVAMRGDADLGTRWSFELIDDTLIIGFPEASAVGAVPRLRRVGDCPASSTRLLGYIPDDSLDRQPTLQVRVSGCADAAVQEQVLFTGPADFGSQIAPWPNADGTWDLWVSSPTEDTARGAIWRFQGASERSDDQRGHEDAQLLEGLEPGDRLGETLVVCGDLTGDGAPDLVVGVPGFSGTTSLNAEQLAGAVMVLSPTTLATATDLTWADASSVLWGAHLDRAGSAIDCTADVDGDGTVDLVVSSPLADVAAGEDGGAVHVVRGGSLPQSGSLGEVAWLTWNASQAGERLGESIAVADLDGDGLVELIAGAPGLTDGGAGAGGVRVLPGTDRGGAGVVFVGRASLDVSDLAAVSRLGTSLRVADLDNDGLLEIIAGAWRSDRDATSLHAGEVVMWPGTLASRVLGGSHAEALVIAGEGPHQEVGRQLQVLDIDGDGTPDVITGARRRAQ